jgi:hypothetical protein
MEEKNSIFSPSLSEMGVRGDRATGCAAGTDLYEGNTSPFQVYMYNEH